VNIRSETSLLVVEPQEEGMRLDVFIASATELSRRAARRLIADGSVQRNRRSTRLQSREMVVGDVIEILQPTDTVRPRLSAVATPEIVFEDDWVLVANKPAGVLSQPAETGLVTELAFDQILLLTLAARERTRPYLRMVHRLDRLTSGAVLFGRLPQALPPLTKAWANGQVDRRYLAVVEGNPDFEARDIDAPIARDPRHAWRFRVDPGGRTAHSVVRVLERTPDGRAIVECRLQTGRTHQVRVHLAEIGHPVVGDRLYGRRNPTLAPRPLLHAANLTFPHPRTGEILRLACPPPDDCARFFSTESAARLGADTNDS
jgi:RluA family pseudouridine synthase